MTDILKIIAEAKRREVEAVKPHFKIGAFNTEKRVSMAEALRKGNGIIAEFKRCSPSKGMIAPMADPARIAAGYEQSGASAISVLTNTQFFGGSLSDLMLARANTNLPILRKEFIIDPYQIAEAKIAGADAILLIASILTRDEVRHLSQYAHECGLEVLLELHSRDEADYPMQNVDMVGVNNRNLRDFSVDIDNTLNMVKELPTNIVRVAESGITSVDDIERLRIAGYQAFLIGERFMSQPDPAQSLNNFLKCR